MTVVIVDIDGTVTQTHNSSERQFFWFLVRHGRIGMHQLSTYVRQLQPAWQERGRHCLKFNKGYFSGLPVETVQQDAIYWLRSRPQGFWRSQLLSRLQAHKAKGDFVVLLSGTPQPVANAFASMLEADKSIGAALPCRDGIYNGEQVCRHPFGAEKCQLAGDLLNKMGVSPRDSIAYADSRHDIELLNMVGSAIAVAPDRNLSRHAQERGWEIL